MLRSLDERYCGNSNDYHCIIFIIKHVMPEFLIFFPPLPPLLALSPPLPPLFLAVPAHAGHCSTFEMF